MEATGNMEHDLSFGIALIVNELTRIADALEDYVYDDESDEEDDDEDEEDGWAETDEDGRVVDESDPSDGPFFVQEPLDIDGFADYPDVDCN